MKTSVRVLFLVFFLSLVSCKEDVKSDIDTMTEVSSDSVVVGVSKEMIQQGNDQKVRESVMTKVMMTPELSRFASYLVSTNLTNMLSTGDGPFAIFAPTDEAFSKLSETNSQMLTNQKNRGLLSNTLGQHIVFMPLRSDYITQALRARDTLKYSTMSGGMILIMKKGDILHVFDQNGREAIIGKSDITGNNGTIHLIDKVLGID